MNTLPERSWFQFLLHAGFVSLAVCCLSNCASTESGYDEALRSARTDCQGNEVVGVWTLRQKSPEKSDVLLLRPDGMGRDRSKLGAESVEERSFTWHYEGAGVWTGEEIGAALAAPGEAPTKRSGKGWRLSYTMRLTQDFLLCEIKPNDKREQKANIVPRLLFGPLGGVVASSIDSHGTTEREVFIRSN